MRAVDIVAHRGTSGDFPENTAVAFQRAIDLGVEMIKFDVQLTADRCLVICHDPSVDRTSDGAGRIGEMCMAEIEELDAGSWFSARYAGERFATLSETLDMMPGGMRLNVHIKASDESRDAPLRQRSEEPTSLLSSLALMCTFRRISPGIMSSVSDRGGKRPPAYLAENQEPASSSSISAQPISPIRPTPPDFRATL